MSETRVAMRFVAFDRDNVIVGDHVETIDDAAMITKMTTQNVFGSSDSFVLSDTTRDNEWIFIAGSDHDFVTHVIVNYYLLVTVF